MDESSGGVTLQTRRQPVLGEWRNGIRAGFRCPWTNVRAGSSPASPTSTGGGLDLHFRMTEDAPPASRSTRTWVTSIAIAVLLAFFGTLFRAELFGMRGERWEQEVEARTEVWLQFLRPDPRLFKTPEEVPEFLENWELAKQVSDEAQIEEIHRRVHIYLDFLETEYADAADIWDSGNDQIISQAARENRKRLTEAFGELGQLIVEQSNDDVREAAFKSSPKTITDPEAANFRHIYQDIRDWTVVAREAVDRHIRLAED